MEYRNDKDAGDSKDECKDKVAIPRHLGIFGCICHFVGLVVGTGIFISPTGVLRGAGGSVGLSFILWIACAIIQTCGALTMAELAVIMKKSGGDFTFILQAWGPLVAFIRLWALETVIMPCGAAVAISTISNYLLTPFFQCEEVPVVSLKFLSVLFLLFVLAVNGISARLASRLAGVLCVTKVVGLAIIIVTGMYNLSKGYTSNFREPFSLASYDPALLPTGLLSGLWAYNGWSVVTTITEEVKSPARNIPLSIVISMSLITAVYLMTNVAYLTLLSPNEILASDAVAADYSIHSLGIRWSWMIWVFVAMSSLGSTNTSIYKSSRTRFSSAREGHLPEILSMVSISRNTPLPAILSCVIALIFLVEDDIIVLVEYLGFIDVVFETVTIAIVPYYRWKYPDMPRPYKVPLVIAFVYMAALLFIASMSLYANPLRNCIALILAFVAIPVYYAMVHPKYKLKRIRPYSVKITRFLQKLFRCVRQEKRTF
ncbi:Y+L amino acid transporter 2-like isoform X2 [Lytechinus pictus]|uniref:Y+L amino acid transporter 2-like isoform X2 n=1 Tax=Lytechinus pictus TaxID=7653 RepID=UPI0030BA1CDD